MVYTSYYGNRNIPEDFIKVQISSTRPTRYTVNLVWDTVAPDWNLVRQIKEGVIDESEYTRRYLGSLEYNRNLILCEFDTICTYLDKGVVLLCYEKSEDFCHRHLLADFLNKYKNAEIKEFS